ncbi:MAG: shikimate dehydrogenase [Tannerellaceae bacterium]|jgi:shikimate dehydrogenase|nr:shikimate dehydrogenase [Tannerellaceae bacterium]
MDKYGLIGYPLGHSFSQVYFNQKFVDEKIDAEYVNFQIADIQEFKYIIEDNPNLCGLNVTLPYKTKVIDFLHEMDADARDIGAVNVIKFIRKGTKLRLKGYNSDILGFKQSISPLLKPYHRRALILGTGGASLAVLHGLKQLGVESVFVSRKSAPSYLTYQELTPRIMEEHTVIVNTTPVGMYPRANQSPDIPFDLISEQHLLYDLIYNPGETLFMEKGKKQGATVKNGLEMLLLQAFVSWKIWTE